MTIPGGRITAPRLAFAYLVISAGYIYLSTSALEATGSSASRLQPIMSVPNMSAIRALQVTAAAHAFISVSHTVKSRSFMNDAQFKSLPRLVAAYARAGWFQGSSLFLIAALLNLRWSQNPLLLTDSLEKALAAVTVATYWATALWYMTQEDNPTSGALTVVGALQVWSAFFASK